MWSSKSRYHANIQDALDYVLSTSPLPPSGESIQALLPHVAAVAVAYGDPDGKYAKFIAKQDNGATHRTWWWHDVKGAFGPKSTVPHQRRDQARWSSRIFGRALLEEREDEIPTETATDALWSPGEEPIRPDIFGVNGDDPVQLDDGVLVTWDDIRPYYATVKPTAQDIPGEESAMDGEEEGADAMDGSDSDGRGKSGDNSRRGFRSPSRIASWL